MRTKLLMATAALALAMPAMASAQGTGPLGNADVIRLSDWRYDDLYTGGWSLENFIDEVEVYGPAGEEIGDIENVVMGPDGRILSVIAEVGGLWDIGDTHVNVPWDQVSLTGDGKGVIIPVTEETVEDFSLFDADHLRAAEAAGNVQEVDDDVEVGPRAWRATELIDDYVRLSDGTNYGYVDDLIIKDGKVAAVVVKPDVAYGVGGPYAYPYYGYGAGWRPGLDYYEMPYRSTDVTDRETFDYGALDDDVATID